ncbi:hypothetical protein BBJ29_007079 [Phytophthora kernoviae]|uniref:Uncharacterized protein n=1 Tax=Phytophthora kernoviae TaxID=325452 RepID=A0A3F2RER5_9STRA|nr:hypothetical protein BBJ29_007079 [Phytophthora kernoviae]RLN54954.1 hypothetical protein BBP00_00008712 [Phytophthora kernoviae]
MASPAWMAEVHGAVDAESETVQATRARPCPEYSTAKTFLQSQPPGVYTLKEGTLFTAGEGVLEGSTRELVLRACKDLSIPVVLEAPKLSERESWQAAFVTSAVRVVIDVTRVLCGEDTGDSKLFHETPIPSATTGFTKRIREQIFAQRMYLQ